MLNGYWDYSESVFNVFFDYKTGLACGDNQFEDCVDDNVFYRRVPFGYIVVYGVDVWKKKVVDSFSATVIFRHQI